MVRLVDDTGLIAIEVPTTWTDVDTAPAPNPDGSTRPYIAASPDRAAFFASFDVPRVALTAIPRTDDLSAVIDAGGLTAGCASMRVEPIVDPDWQGVIQIGERCGAAATGFWAMAVATVNRTGATGVTHEIRQTAVGTGAAYALLMFAVLDSDAHTAWQSGRCVLLEASAAPWADRPRARFAVHDHGVTTKPDRRRCYRWHGDRDAHRR